MKKFNFEDLPNTDTPIKASTLNTMQSNIEESCVAVSPTQPETNEKVWIQKGKNLFDINKLQIDKIWQATYKINDDKSITINNTGTSGVSYVVTNKHRLKSGTYTFSAKITGQLQNIKIFNSNGLIIESSSTSITFSLTDDDYIYFYFYVWATDTSNSIQISKIQIEQGSTATEYEAYVEKKIWCKNDNGVFEECKFKNDYSDLILIKEQSDNTELTLDGNAAVFRNPYHEEIAGYTFVGTVTGYGNGNVGLLVSGNGWCFNSKSSSQTWTSITWINFFVKK